MASCAQAQASTCRTSKRAGGAAPRRSRPFGEAHPRRRARDRVDVAVACPTRSADRGRGLTDIAIGVSGIAAVVDLRETPGALGRILHVTEVAIADEIAAAAELVMGKAAGIPVAIVRGLDPEWFGDGSYRDLVRPPNEDLFR
jgi:coenzyme F420-0:L-glutamate ligase/coenzyme F420-1:gamma-L-glutamate ligase